MSAENRQPLAITTPIMTRERFAELSGLSADAVRGQINRRQLATCRIGKRVMINLARYAFATTTTPVIIIPLVSKKCFADAAGLTERGVEAMIHADHLPSTKIGKRVLVDVAELTRRCMQDETTATSNA